MPEIASKGPELKVPTLQGIDLRSARNQLTTGRCDRIFGLHPKQTGLQARMPGKTLWRVFEDEDENPEEVLQVAQVLDDTGNIIVQAGDTIGLYTLDELRNRTITPDLTPIPVPGETDNVAILAHIMPSGTNGGALGSSTNYFYTRIINTILTDEGGMIVQLSGNSFVLANGTYRIDAVLVSGRQDISGFKCAAGLWSVSAGNFKTNISSTTEILGVSGSAIGFSGSSQGVFTIESTNIRGRFQVTQDVEVFQIRQAGLGGWVTSTAAQGVGSSVFGKPGCFATITIERET